MDQQPKMPGGEVEPEPETMLCPACLAENDPSANFCVKCDAPLSAAAVLGPFEQTRAQRFIFHRAATNPGSLMVVVGVWVIFGSMALASAIIAPFILAPSGFFESRFEAFVLASEIILIGSFSAALVWRTTVNYRRQRRAPARSDPGSKPARPPPGGY